MNCAAQATRPTAPRGSGLESLDLVRRELRVGRDEDQPLDLGLGDQHPIERISMVRRQVSPPLYHV
jgi:hypothetical protein